MASILTKKPAHLLEAVELFWMYVLVSEVLEEIKKDCPYYGTEGGVTLSGGEPLLQADFAAALLKECKKVCAGAHTRAERGCRQATLYFSRECASSAERLFLYDRK